jgi:hypothetical protein
MFVNVEADICRGIEQTREKNRAQEERSLGNPHSFVSGGPPSAKKKDLCMDKPDIYCRVDIPLTLLAVVTIKSQKKLRNCVRRLGKDRLVKCHKFAPF